MTRMFENPNWACLISNKLKLWNHCSRCHNCPLLHDEYSATSVERTKKSVSTNEVRSSHPTWSLTYPPTTALLGQPLQLIQKFSNTPCLDDHSYRYNKVTYHGPRMVFNFFQCYRGDHISSGEYEVLTGTVNKSVPWCQSTWSSSFLWCNINSKSYTWNKFSNISSTQYMKQDQLWSAPCHPTAQPLRFLYLTIHPFTLDTQIINWKQ